MPHEGLRLKAIAIDRPGKDSYRLREASCSEVLLLGKDRWALMHELRGADVAAVAGFVLSNAVPLGD